MACWACDVSVGYWGNSSKQAKEWWVYIIRASDDSLYTGISTDVERRFKEHVDGRVGARYFYGRKPTCVVYREHGHTRSSASQREFAIKSMSRKQKLDLIDQSK
jgi:putative endonuclease